MSSSQRRLALSGPTGSGKNALGESIFTILGTDVARLSVGNLVRTDLAEILADVRAIGVKESAEAHALTNTELSYVLDPLRGKSTDPTMDNGPEIRAALQRLGTEIRCTKEPEYYFSAILHLIDELPVEEPMLICDLRWPHEAASLRQRGFCLVRVTADTDIRRQRAALRDGTTPDEELEHHLVETALDDFKDWDAVVFNDSTLDYAAQTVIEALSWSHGA